MVRVSACPGRSLGTSPSFSTNVSACGQPGTGPFAKVQYRVLIIVHSLLGPPIAWALPSGVITYGGLFGDITTDEPGEVKHRAGLTADRRPRSDLGRQHREFCSDVGVCTGLCGSTVR